MSALLRRLHIQKEPTEILRGLTADRFPVDIILPQYWHDPVLYRIQCSVEIGEHTIPRGYVTDGGTIPRWAWLMFPPVCQYFAATLVHDYLLDSGHGRKYCWQEFRMALRESGISRWRRAAMLTAVRLGDYYYVWFKGKPA